MDGAPTVEMMKRGHAGPVDEAIDQVICDGIGENVANLLEHRVGGGEEGGAGRLARPEILPSAPANVEAAREHRVEAREERGEAVVGIVHDGVEMIRHGNPRDELDPMALRGLGEAVGEDAVGLSCRAAARTDAASSAS